MRSHLLAAAAFAACASVGACAPTPESIQPAYVSEVPYQSWTCQQLGEEELRLTSALATAGIQQNTARSNDTMGVIFLGLPVGSMSGQSIAPQIARYKGEQEAIHRATIRNHCAEQIVPVYPAPPAPPPGLPTSAPPAATVSQLAR
jgi:hypothetical protein